MSFEEKVVESISRYRGEVIDVYQQTVKLPDGELANRDVVKHQGAVGVLALTDDGKAIFEEQWRTPIGKLTIEIPAGKVEPGEDLLETAKRELNEETRYEAGKIEKINGFYSAPGFSNEYMTLYKAINLKKVTKELPRDQGENLNIFELSLDEALKAVAEGKIEDAKTILAIYYWKANIK
ncbi:NUDIX hydrolase [Pediococcus pentosaceus]|uniref:NUDIX hydrolase n=1 Tax=Pediococcus pentosaceus TaxID=1255 RepID=UPI00133065CF|nr:NUDIX hydrolase [Pediococcus pentosaceus]KAF0349395.1 NUDIX domain-containing protein [Pediococcus pentosaceus]MBF7105345.1 NUDIX hydrolase [Pediococcus pentosaceus]